MKRICNTKNEVIEALPIVREAFAAATSATLDCTAETITLTILIDFNIIVGIVEQALARQKLRPPEPSARKLTRGQN